MIKEKLKNDQCQKNLEAADKNIKKVTAEKDDLGKILFDLQQTTAVGAQNKNITYGNTNKNLNNELQNEKIKNDQCQKYLEATYENVKAVTAEKDDLEKRLTGLQQNITIDAQNRGRAYDIVLTEL